MKRSSKIVAALALGLGLAVLGFGLGRGMSGGAAGQAPRRIERVVLPTLPAGATASLEVPDLPPLPAAPGVAAAPVFHPRAADEWQGMQVNQAMQATCDTSARCGLGMACHEGRCGACTADAECATGEVCALDHCVKQALASCRGRSDCTGAALCVLSGYSADARGNADMTASCRIDGGGVPASDPEQVARPETRPAPPAAVDPEALMASLRAAP